jgi:hypothetical protein
MLFTRNEHQRLDYSNSSEIRAHSNLNAEDMLSSVENSIFPHSKFYKAETRTSTEEIMRPDHAKKSDELSAAAPLRPDHAKKSDELSAAAPQLMGMWKDSLDRDRSAVESLWQRFLTLDSSLDSVTGKRKKQYFFQTARGINELNESSERCLAVDIAGSYRRLVQSGLQDSSLAAFNELSEILPAHPHSADVAVRDGLLWYRRCGWTQRRLLVRLFGQVENQKCIKLLGGLGMLKDRNLDDMLARTGTLRLKFVRIPEDLLPSLNRLMFYFVQVPGRLTPSFRHKSSICLIFVANRYSEDTHASQEWIASGGMFPMQIW